MLLNSLILPRDAYAAELSRMLSLPGRLTHLGLAIVRSAEQLEWFIKRSSNRAFVHPLHDRAGPRGHASMCPN